MSVIEVSHLTKDYGSGRGVFDVSIHVKEGECFGFLGPNGAGKTTTIRHLMGFSKPQKGTCYIAGLDSWQDAANLKHTVGYLPGEVALPRGLTGVEFLNMMKKMRKMQDDRYLKELLDRFELDPTMDIHQMSLGVKRKLAVVTAFMHDPDILILDEPTSGLDPIMQQTFIQYILSEKTRKKTILLSSHIFHEIDETCDRISIIKDGKIEADFEAADLKNRSQKIYRVSFEDKESYELFTAMPYQFTSKNPGKLRARVAVKNQEITKLISDVTELSIIDFQEIPFTLEDYFMQFYKEERTFEGVR